MQQAQAAQKNLDAVKMAADMEVSAADLRADEAREELSRVREQLEQAKTFAEGMQKRATELESEQTKLRPVLQALLDESCTGVRQLRESAAATAREPGDAAEDNAVHLRQKCGDRLWRPLRKRLHTGRNARRNAPHRQLGESRIAPGDRIEG